MCSVARRWRPAAIVSTLGCLAGMTATLAPPAHANPLTVAGYQLKAADGRTLAHADCLTDRAAEQTTFCQALVGRGDGTAPAKSGSQTLQWLRDARTAGAATMVFTEDGDGFAGQTTYAIPTDDTSAYEVSTVGSYPPSTQRKVSHYEISSINALAAEIDCLTGRSPDQVTSGPYGPYCRLAATRPVAQEQPIAGAAHQRHDSRRHHKSGDHRR
jgi:hypothetical protein